MAVCWSGGVMIRELQVSTFLQVRPLVVLDCAMGSRRRGAWTVAESQEKALPVPPHSSAKC